MKGHKEPPKLAIILIGYNSMRFLKHCLDGVTKQKFKDVVTYFIDNNSSDESVKFVKKKYPKVRVVANRENTGYVGASNQGIKMTKSKYVMILNPDLIMPPDYLQKIIKVMEEDKKIGAITGKVLKYDFKKDKPTNRIDTAGLYFYRNRRVVDRGQGQVDKGQYDKEEQVFGISGAVPVYRREALEDVKLPMLTKERMKHDDYSDLESIRNAYEYLDEDFFMYKEDIDISWRLRLRGWKCYYAPKAVCYHGRGTGAVERSSLKEIGKGRRELSRLAKYYSYKNQRLMQAKNDLWGQVLRDLPFILFKEILTFGYILLREPYVLKAFGKFWLQLPHALKKRRLIMKRRKATPKQISKWTRGKADA